jgi:mRNA-degrading endonuclease RelE of RelBE toxin-antitoxin system
LAIREIVVPASVRRDLQTLPPHIREAFYKKLSLYVQNPRHPSLRVHKLLSKPGILSLSLSRTYRVTFFLEGEQLVVEAVGTHEIYR